MNVFKRIFSSKKVEEPDPIIGEIWEEKEHENPFEEFLVVRILAVREGWVQYSFSDTPPVFPTSTEIRIFKRIYKRRK